MQDEVGVYRQKLEEPDRALDDAYAQFARCSRLSPGSPPPAMTTTGSGSTMAMTVVEDADLTAVYTTTDQREAATPCGEQRAVAT
jgi:hypothetical protein